MDKEEAVESCSFVCRHFPCGWMKSGALEWASPEHKYTLVNAFITQTHTYTETETQTHTHRHTHRHTYTHIHTNTHTHTRWDERSSCVKVVRCGFFYGHCRDWGCQKSSDILNDNFTSIVLRQYHSFRRAVVKVIDYIAVGETNKILVTLSRLKKNTRTVATRFNVLEGTWKFWSLNLNDINLNFSFFCYFFSFLQLDFRLMKRCSLQKIWKQKIGVENIDVHF